MTEPDLSPSDEIDAIIDGTDGCTQLKTPVVEHHARRKSSRTRRLAANVRARRIGAVLTGLCGVVALVSASGKLTNQAAVVELLDHVEVYGPLRDLLPVLQLAAGLGALGGLIRFPRLGVASLTGLALYFVGAVIAHLRVGDGLPDIAVPLGYVMVMAATAALRAATIDTDT